jgi:hypothetical protein
MFSAMSMPQTSVIVDPDQPDTWPAGDSDWARLRSMTDEEIETAARSDPDAQPLSEAQLASMRRPSRGLSTLR